ncbi:TIR domain-containing protein [Streptococcus mitis]|jgi:hypothetical protein|uniref:TIR domain-containing protein n=1 Tax=Streptococcus mitis TaxID=28037 RepID=UPI0021B560CB|nr:TIR domain-containing protein [Streptococcus mitis]
MAYKTFISYKYDESQALRDAIIEKLGNDAIYYCGETSISPNLTDLKTYSIKEKLKDMIYNTSITIVILSPKMSKSKWIEWEIEYSLKEIKRGNKYSRTNGVVAIISKVDGSYDWFKHFSYNHHRKPVINFDMEKTFKLISNNHFNSNPPIWHCSKCKTYDSMYGSYISFIEEDNFLNNINYYLDNAYEKSRNRISDYTLIRKR